MISLHRLRVDTAEVQTDGESCMNNSILLPLLACGLASLPGALAAQTESGPKAGARVEALKVLTVTGDNAGKEINYTAERKGKPTVVVFVQADKWDRPTARFLRALDQELSKDRIDVQVVAVWLTEDVDKSKDYLPRAQQSLKLSQTTFTVWTRDRSGPPGWAINADAHVTAVVAEEGKVSASFGYGSVNETEAPTVLKKLKAKR
jgi:hypothetical protein